MDFLKLGRSRPAPLVINLRDACSYPLEQVGSKAQRLAAMMEAGLPVPCGWVVLERAFEIFCRENGLVPEGKEITTEDVIKGTLPKGVLEAISQAMKDSSAGKRFAVRSSSCAEDGAEFSMAGQFQTVLDVCKSDLSQAIKRCWASRFASPVSAYLEKRSSRQVPTMGVIIQEQIQPEFSGVIFTVDPLNRSSDHLVVEWVSGLGEKLVSGKVVPERIRLGRSSKTVPEGVPTTLVPHLIRLRDLALGAERMFSQPVDMEWCCTKDELYILQSRPVTGICGSHSVAWTNANMAENFPRPLVPLAWSAVDAFYTAYMRCALRLFGWSDARLARLGNVVECLNGIHCGRIYYNLNNWYRVMYLFPIGRWLARFLDTYIGQKTTVSLGDGGLGHASGGTFRKWVDSTLFWPRFFRCLAVSGRRMDQAEPAFSRTKALWRKEASEDPSPKGCLGVLDDIFRFVDQRWQACVLADLKVMVGTGLLELLVERWVKGETGQMLAALMEGVEVKSTEPVRYIWNMAQMIKGDSELARLLKDRRYQELEGSLGPGEQKALEGFMQEFGGRCYHDCMLVYPTFEERHDLFWDLVRGYMLSKRPSPDSSCQVKVKRSGPDTDLPMEIKALPFWKRLLLERVLSSARKAMQLRERGRLLQSMLFGEIRRTCLLLARPLVERGHLAEQEEIFYLHLSELRDLVDGKFQFPELISELVALRKRALKKSEKYELPEFFLTDWAEYWKPEVSVQKHSDAASLRGLGVSHGKARGRVRVVLDPSMGHELRRGEIMVARTTDPGWTPLFFLAGGLVLERGGMLSHGSIVAREFGIPAVVGLEGACSILRDGQDVEIDGTSGTVTLFSSRHLDGKGQGVKGHA